jgi:hypothetical protein
VVHAALGERGEEPLERLRRVLPALLGRDPVARVARRIGEVQVADVRDADDERLGVGAGC